MGTISLHKQGTINAGADRLWQILTEEFTEVHRWASSVDHSELNRQAPTRTDGAPAGRVCQVPGFGTTDERMTKYDTERLVMAYSVTAEKIPGFFRGLESQWTLTALGDDRTKAEVRIGGEAVGVLGAVMSPVMKRKFSSTLDQIFEDLKVYAETGQVSAAKQKVIAKAA